MVFSLGNSDYPRLIWFLYCSAKSERGGVKLLKQYARALCVELKHPLSSLVIPAVFIHPTAEQKYHSLDNIFSGNFLLILEVRKAKTGTSRFRIWGRLIPHRWPLCPHRANEQKKGRGLTWSLGHTFRL